MGEKHRHATAACRRHWLRRVALTLVLGTALALFLGAGMAQAQEVPVAFIKVAEVNRLLRDGTPALFVDVRGRQQYLVRHIKGAVSIPLNAVEARHREIPRQGLVVLY